MYPSSTPDSRLGVTLIEVLIAATLLLLLTGLFFTILVPTFRAHSRGSVRADLQRTALLALERLAADVERSTPAALSLRVMDPDPCPVVLGIVRLEDVQPDGRRLWEQKAVFYLWHRETRRLLRGERLPAPPVTLTGSQAYRFSQLELAAVANSGQEGSYQVLAREVEKFEVSHGAGSGANVTQPLRVRLRLEKPGSHQAEPESFEAKSTIFLEN